MDHALNGGLLAFHTAWIIFNATGWMWQRTRRWHLFTIALTALSWFGLGAWYGWGYCLFTDWHWAVRERLGYRDDPASYMQLLIAEVLRISVSAFWADAVTGALFALVTVLTVVFNLRDVRLKLLP
jgi:Protein of Unknown function (DUF2784)